jgi:hypothetical protein
MGDVMTSRSASPHEPAIASPPAGPRRDRGRPRRSGAPARIVMVARGDERRAWRIIDAFAERTGLEARRSERVAEFLLRSGLRDVQVVGTLADIDREWRRHVALGPLTGGMDT